ncbi:uncharacterized protein LY79DRAFT_264550 [Colletotrichum navitas]|uniref:Secreted protein n=1 Tax=Colletotrichum navitas TaxID=681940 RepID=A0AAD8PX68_9PEZI|nr:uncharacterized protein LY79DRAFT_264550 [Colletotrichum navitas]KAK1585704.1 hypothetical protein LY79DRAFT_264550 [Colletotrichum navitas]
MPAAPTVFGLSALLLALRWLARCLLRRYCRRCCYRSSQCSCVRTVLYYCTCTALAQIDHCLSPVTPTRQGRHRHQDLGWKGGRLPRGFCNHLPRLVPSRLVLLLLLLPICCRFLTPQTQGSRPGQPDGRKRTDKRRIPRFPHTTFIRRLLACLSRVQQPRMHARGKLASCSSPSRSNSRDGVAPVS